MIRIIVRCGACGAAILLATASAMQALGNANWTSVVLLLLAMMAGAEIWFEWRGSRKCKSVCERAEAMGRAFAKIEMLNATTLAVQPSKKRPDWGKLSEEVVERLPR